jgi:hypothetical protein
MWRVMQGYEFIGPYLENDGLIFWLPLAVISRTLDDWKAAIYRVWN